MNLMKLKMFLSVFLVIILVAACAGCGNNAFKKIPTNSADPGNPESSDLKTSEKRLEKYSPEEYILYQNIFFNGYGKEYDGSSVKKEGVFATIYDAYNNRQRYYVWGYYDQTKCCDWQWEFVPQEGETLPAVGSLVTVSGTFVSSKDALDGYWITGAHTELKTAYTGSSPKYDMCSMSCTLERVQIYNIISHPDVFQDQDFSAYGRIASINSLEDPYYNNSWKINIKWDGVLPAIGTLVEISGSIQNGMLVVHALNKM